MIKKVGALGFVLLLLVTSVFSQEKVEAYLNKILDFHEKTVKEIAARLPESERNWYVPLHRDYRVIIEPYDEPFAIVDLTTESSQKYIYISAGYLSTRIEINQKIIKWELKSEAELAGILAHELGHLVSAQGKKPAIYDEEHIKQEAMMDDFAVNLLREEGYQPMAVIEPLERYLDYYDYFEQFVSKDVFQKRVQLTKELVLEAMAEFPANEYKKFIIATQKEFEEMKELIKSGK